MMPPSDIQSLFALWPNLPALAADLGMPRATVQKWPQRGGIPPRHHLRLAEVAAARGLPVTLEDIARLHCPAQRDLSVKPQHVEAE